ncbi:MAG: hypothetical protein R3D68_17705 [Hyphomicrobiaceae bacterium]
MRFVSALAANVLALAVLVPAAHALPKVAAGDLGSTSENLVEQVQAGWKYHRSCVWLGNGWGYRHRGKVIVCRPHRPRGGHWVWHSEGGRQGWYDQRRRSWHHRKW